MATAPTTIGACERSGRSGSDDGSDKMKSAVERSPMRDARFLSRHLLRSPSIKGGSLGGNACQSTRLRGVKETFRCRKDYSDARFARTKAAKSEALRYEYRRPEVIVQIRTTPRPRS